MRLDHTISETGAEGLIRVLPDTLINKIAAGEVVERPASVAKELIENALDAGAENITLILRKAGRDRIQVVDDGCGMTQSDALLSLRRHATSKISSVEDLHSIRTLGFRGEALASIAAVSQVTLRTRRPEDEVGTLIRVDGGEASPPEPVAAEPGTSVSVQNLFFNVPARRNFLKSNATEFKHLLDTFQLLALSHPEIGFCLLHDEQVLHRLDPPPPEASFEEALATRVAQLYPGKKADALVPVAESTSYLSVRGFVSKPDFNRKTRGDQFLYINRRFIRDRRLDHAVMQAYGEMLPKGAYPFFALFIHLDPQHVDVNVHPTKAEVKFDDDRGIYGFLLAVIRKALGSADLRPQAAFRSSGLYGREDPFPRDSVFSRTEGGDGSRGEIGPEDLSKAWAAVRHPWSPQANQKHFFGPDKTRPAEPPEPADTQSGITLIASRFGSEEAAGDTLIWQLHEKYILARIRSGLMIVDQHAAHERILYEKALVAMENGIGMTQQLLFPHSLEFEPGDFELLLELLADLRALGFDIERFGGRSVIIRGVPTDIRVGDERVILEEILDQYREYQSNLRIQGRDNLAKSLACRTAIKTGQRLTYSEMQSLIDQLFQCKMPYACPHGRPTMIRISLQELDRRFGRIGHLERD
ncbi:MAG TPA: DNA mismatch repair endonuclease MutL [Rhodothermia bacterium]|nr:DNA mismatch repair endonuclease MutL [Rhodothermia bacterium]